MNKEEKQAVEEFIKKCNKYNERVEIKGVSVGEENRILDTVCKALNSIEKLQKENELLRKDIEGWKKYCEEIEEERIEMSNKNCELEFEVEKLQKENEELKNNGVIDENKFEFAVDCDYDRLKRLIDTADKSEEFILYNNEKWIKEKYSVSTEKIKDKIEEKIKEAEKDLQEAIRLEKEAKAKEGTILWWTAQIRLDERIKVLKELLEEGEQNNGE